MWRGSCQISPLIETRNNGVLFYTTAAYRPIITHNFTSTKFRVNWQYWEYVHLFIGAIVPENDDINGLTFLWSKINTVLRLQFLKSISASSSYHWLRPWQRKLNLWHLTLFLKHKRINSVIEHIKPDARHKIDFISLSRRRNAQFCSRNFDIWDIRLHPLVTSGTCLFCCSYGSSHDVTGISVVCYTLVFYSLCTIWTERTWNYDDKLLSSLSQMLYVKEFVSIVIYTTTGNVHPSIPFKSKEFTKQILLQYVDPWDILYRNSHG